MRALASTVILSWGWRRAGLTLLAGAIAALSLPPVGFFFALFIALPMLVWLIDGATGGTAGGGLRSHVSAFATGWLFGFGYFVAGLWWLGNALMLEAEEFAWALPLAVLGLPAVLALFYGVATLIARLLWSEGFGRVCALGFAFGLAEWLRSFVATGFPWNAIGYGAMPTPVMMQSAHVLGVFGVSALAVVVFAAPALIGTGRGARIGLTVGCLLLLAHFGYGGYRLAQPLGKQVLNVRLVQPAIDQSRKMSDQDRDAIFDEHLQLTAAAGRDGIARPDIVVWPETSLPFILTENPDALSRIAATLGRGQLLLTGAVRAEDRGPGQPPRYYNSIYAIDDQGQIVAASDKVHLTPFGEYVPLEKWLRRIGVDNIVSLPGGFSAAASRQILSLPGGRKFLPLICYEVIFPGELGSDPASADAIINITNDAWFGASPGPYQHFQQARLRAVENDLPVIRDANNGISAVIDGRGRVVSGIDLDIRGFVDATVNFDSVSERNNHNLNMYYWLTMVALVSVASVSRVGFISAKN